MSDHSTAVVPLGAWSYHSPRLARVGRRVDLGTFAEALIYYDRVLVVIQSPGELEALVQRFVRDGLHRELISLFDSGHLTMLHFAFDSAPVQLTDQTYTLINLQGQEQVSEERSFESTILNRADLSCLPHGRQRASILSAVRKRAIELKAADFAGGVDDAHKDLFHPQRSSLLVQCLVDEIYDLLGQSGPPTITATVADRTGGRSIQWNFDLRTIAGALGQAPFGEHSPASAAIHANRLIWAASLKSCDLFVGSPMSRIVAAKFYDVASTTGRTGEIIQELEEQAEFPDVASLVVDDLMNFEDVLAFRRHARPFREWLRDESERDRALLFAYHTEVAREVGYVSATRRIVRLLAVAAPIAIQALHPAASATDRVVLGAVGAASRFVLEKAAHWQEGWSPVMFGAFARRDIETKIAKREGEAFRREPLGLLRKDSRPLRAKRRRK